MQKAHSPINWKNYPSEDTPVNETNLNKMDGAINEIDNRVCEMYISKFDKTSASGLIRDVTLNSDTGVLTIYFYDGSSKAISTNMAKIAVNIAYDAENERLVLTMPDGTYTYVNMSALITQYEFLDSDTLTFTVNENGKVTATIRKGSVTADMLQPDYLADIIVQVGIVTQKAEEAAAQASIATTEADRAKTEADKAAQYSSVIAPNFYLDIDTMTLYMKDGVGVDFKLVGGTLYWKIV